MERVMMKMSNSPLVSYTKLSPNHSGLRTHKIDTITPHCVVGHLSLQSLGNVFAPETRQASANYGIDDKGKVGMYVEEKNRSWASSSNANDQRAVTIEIACDLKPPYKITDAALHGLIALCVDVCKRNNIPQLLWKDDKSLIGKVEQQNITIHQWFKNTQCPGEYILSQLDYVATEVNKILNPKPVVPNKPTSPIVKPSTGYVVTVKTETLYVRKGPGTNYPVVDVVHKGQAFAILEESFGIGSSKWGRLKSDVGWIALDHCATTR